MISRSSPPTTKWLPIHGATAAICSLLHDGHHIQRGSAHDLLWACNVAVPLISLGCFLGRPIFCAIGLLWLSFGTPIWLLDLATGAGMIVTSPLVHIAAPLIACLALRRLGWPRHAWLAASLASIVLLAISRLVGSAGPNVNLAFRVHQGWEARFSSHALFLLLFIAVSSALFFVLDRLLYSRIFSRPAGTR